MANVGFGLTQLDILGSGTPVIESSSGSIEFALGSGTPKIESTTGDLELKATNIRLNGVVNFGSNTITIDGDNGFINTGIITASNGVDVGSGVNKVSISTVQNSYIPIGLRIGSGVTMNGNGDSYVGVLTASSFIKTGGTSSQYLMADGSTSTGGGGGGGVTINNNTDNCVITASGISNTINGEANLTWDGSILNSNHSNGKIEINPSNGCIELTRTSGDAFIDFKNSPSDDYDVRIAQDGTSGGLVVTGNLRTTGILTANSFVKTGGTSSQYLMADGSVSTGGGGGGISSVVEDTTPQLGGNLDLNSKTINGTGAIDVSGTITGTGVVADTMSINSYIYHTGDTDTFIGFESNNTFRVNTNGSDKFKINSSGHLILADDNDTYIHHPSSDTIGFTAGGFYGFSYNANGLTVNGTVGAGNFSGNTFTKIGGTSSQYLMADGSVSTGGGTTINNNADNRVITGSNSANTLEAESSLTYDGTTLTATSFSGGGNDIVTSKWTVGANGSSWYTFTGPGGLSSSAQPKIYLARGQTYEFLILGGSSHPFQIQQSNGTAYNTGVTNNNVQQDNVVVKFEVPFSAPNTLQYVCTVHGGMGNTIIVYPDLSP